jgi:hypothetical protein
LASQETFLQAWPALSERLEDGHALPGLDRRGERFVAAWPAHAAGRPYLEAVQALPPEVKDHGTAWLQAIVDETASWSEG